MGFIARGQQQKGWVIAVSADDRLRFRVKLTFHFTAGAEAVPHPGLDLQVKTQFVRRRKRRIGRAPGMKAHVVQPIVLARLHDFLPRCEVGGRITRPRKIAAEMGAAQIKGTVVEHELCAVRVNFSHAKSSGDLRMKSLAGQSGSQTVNFGIKFRPFFKVLTHRKKHGQIGFPGRDDGGLLPGFERIGGEVLRHNLQRQQRCAGGCARAVAGKKSRHHSLMLAIRIEAQSFQAH